MSRTWEEFKAGQLTCICSKCVRNRTERKLITDWFETTHALLESVGYLCTPDGQKYYCKSKFRKVHLLVWRIYGLYDITGDRILISRDEFRKRLCDVVNKQYGVIDALRVLPLPIADEISPHLCFEICLEPQFFSI